MSVIIKGNLDLDKNDYTCYPEQNEENSYVCLGFKKQKLNINNKINQNNGINIQNFLDNHNNQTRAITNKASNIDLNGLQVLQKGMESNLPEGTYDFGIDPKTGIAYVMQSN